MKKGQKVFVKTTGNAARNGTKIFEAEVVSVGRKYFTLEAEGRWLGRTKFSLESMIDVSEYTADYKVYLSMKELEEEPLKPIKEKEITLSLRGKSYEELIRIEEFINAL